MGADREKEQSTVTVDDSDLRPAAGVGVTLLFFHRGGVVAAELREGACLVVGRAADADLSIDDPGLSRHHARFALETGALWVEDLASKNGTSVRGQTVERARIAPGDPVQLGPVAVSLIAGPLEERRDHDALLVELERAVVRAHLYRSVAALLLVRALDPSRSPISGWFVPLSALCAASETVALYDRATVEILVTGATDAAHLARRIVQAGLDNGAPLCCGVALYPEAATSAEELVGACREALAGASLEQPVCIAPARNDPGLLDEDPRPVIASPLSRALYETVARVAGSSLPILIQGETGTGKELVAAAIHRASPRRALPLRCINCGAIPAQLTESLLFGHERGAFTGADQLRVGIFEEASGGTVLLDEVGELSPGVQASLLRVLESGRFSRVGGAGREISVDVRVIAATNRDLEAMCDDGSFRRDLLFRLNAVTLHVPPLRDRPEEIVPLAEHFLERTQRRRQRPGVRSFSPEALELLRRYRWPGNVRELRNVVERALVMSRGETVAVEDLSERVRAVEPDAGTTDEVHDFRRRIQRFEAELILEALQAAGWNQTEAARRLHMPLRSMVRKIQAYGLRERRSG